MIKNITILLLMIVFSSSFFGQQWTSVDTVLRNSNGLNLNIKSFNVIGDSLIVNGAFNIVDSYQYPLNSGFISSYIDGNWNPIDNGLYVGFSNSVAKYNGKLVFGGGFWDASGVPNTKYLAQWNGTSWESLSSQILNGSARAIKSYNNKLFVAGGFGTIGSQFVWGVTAFNGTTWEEFNGGVGNPIDDMEIYKGDLYFGGSFGSIAGVSASRIAKYDGTTFTEVGGGLNGYVNTFYVDPVKDELYVGGYFTMAGDSLARAIVKWDGQNWHPLGEGVDCDVYTDAIAVYHGDLYVGGCFTKAGTDSISYIARWNGEKWDSLGLGVNAEVDALAVYNDTLWVGGYFTEAGGQPSYGLAKWYTPKPPPTEQPNQIYGTGMDEFNSENVLIYPNPSSGIISIEAPVWKDKTVNINIYNLEGKNVFEKKVKFQNETYLLNFYLQNGMYQISLSDGENKVSKKVLIANAK